MATAKAINLSVRPTQSADLCFPVDGIIEYLPSEWLGRGVEPVDVNALTEELKPKAELPFPSGGIIFPPVNPPPTPVPPPIGDGPDQIKGRIGEALLAKLRSGDVATDLTQTLCWYGLKDGTDESSSAINKRIKLLGYDPDDSDSLFHLVGRLSERLQKRHDRLETAYAGDEFAAVSNPITTATTTSGSDGTSHSVTNGTASGTTDGSQNLNTNSTTTTITEGRDLLTPRLDNEARNLRAQIGLRQEQLSAYRMVKLNTVDSINYQKAISASEVRRLQLALIDRYLLPPFGGVVTAIFRNVGDFVTVGQPVLRLEDDTEVYLVGTIKCRSLIRIGYYAKVTTTLFGEPGASPITLEGRVCAIRGHEPIDEQWNVMIRCKNIDDEGERILPLNYNFDFNFTDIYLAAP